MPDVPTVAEQRLSRLRGRLVVRLLRAQGHAGGGDRQLNKAVNEIIAVPAIEAQLVREGADPAGGTPQQFGQFVQREFEKWRHVVRESGATAE